ncbi:DM13 domain-containing protein [bacterium]|nr:DM13 domain-containing protein [bacterium]
MTSIRGKMLQKLAEIFRRNVILFGIFNVFVGLTIGFGLGVYSLPILTAETGLDDSAIAAQQPAIERLGKFHRNLEGSDSLHWGEGTSWLVMGRSVWLDGSVSPGPDYRLYFAPIFVETGESFLAIKSQSVEVGSIKAFTNFTLQLPDGVNVDGFLAVVIWCEAFS